MRIHLPNSAYLGNIDAFLRGFDPSEPGALRITANENWISVHPVVISMIAALGTTLTPGQIKCDPFEARSCHYLQRMGLFRILGVPEDASIVEHDPSGRFIPLTQIRNSTELTAFVREMIPLLHLSPEPAKTIAYIVSELVRNVIEHADAPNGAFLCAQYYKKSNSIRIGIADTGAGIKTTINRSHEARTDLDAIRLALRPGITGTTPEQGGTEQNAGAGLFFIKSIATVNHDFFVLYSGSGFYKLLRSKAQHPRLNADPFDDRHSREEALPRWRGTVVGIDISLDGSEEFSRLLSAIRNTYSLAIRERTHMRYKRPRFI